jgi:hypothetical protein
VVLFPNQPAHKQQPPALGFVKRLTQLAGGIALFEFA